MKKENKIDLYEPYINCCAELLKMMDTEDSNLLYNTYKIKGFTVSDMWQENNLLYHIKLKTFKLNNVAFSAFNSGLVKDSVLELLELTAIGGILEVFSWRERFEEDNGKYCSSKKFTFKYRQAQMYFLSYQAHKLAFMNFHSYFNINLDEDNIKNHIELENDVKKQIRENLKMFRGMMKEIPVTNSLQITDNKTGALKCGGTESLRTTK